MVGVETKTGIEAIKEAQKYFGKKPDLIITDVPTKALNQFVKLANEEFKPEKGTAHYGFCLREILEGYFELQRLRKYLYENRKEEQFNDKENL